MSEPIYGRPVRFYVPSDDFSTPTPVVIYSEDGSTITLSGKQRLAITTLVVSNGGTARLMTFITDADAGGDIDTAEVLWRGSMAANSCETMNYLGVPLLAGVGIPPEMAAAGASTGSSVSGTGFITRT